MQPTSGNSQPYPPQKFHRLILLRLFPLTFPVAVASPLLFPAGPALGVAIVVIMLGTVAFVVPYQSDMVTVYADGPISVGRQTLRPENYAGCRYRRIVISGRSFRLSGFALYSRMSQGELPKLFVPAHGWLRSDRTKLFEALSAWLDAAGGNVDERARRRLDELRRG